MTLLAILLLVIAVTALWLIRSRNSSSPKTVQRHKHKSRSPYHAVRVECSFAACDAAHELQGKPFLSRQAPTIPLPECDHNNCKCRFSHQPDRRMDDRRSPFSNAAEEVVLANQSDRRHRVERRQLASGMG